MIPIISEKPSNQIIFFFLNLALLSLLFALVIANQASAVTYTVSRQDDPQLSTSCTEGSCSLRQAIISAQNNPGSTIILPEGIYTLTIPGNDDSPNITTNPANGDLDIFVETTILGAGMNKTILQSGENIAAFSGFYRIFDNFSNKKNVTIADLTVRNGKDIAGSSGGCIRNLGIMTLRRVKLTGCESPISGGGISTYHKLTMLNSVIEKNRVYRPDGYIANGGGIISGPGPTLGTDANATIIQSIIRNNISTSEGEQDLRSFGGGISNTARLSLSQCTVTGNFAMNAGGIINGTTGVMSIDRSTISNNKARFDTGGIDNEYLMAITNSTISGNIAGFKCLGSECDRAYAGGIVNWDEDEIINSRLTIDNSTISGNQSVMGGGGILNAKGEVIISNSTIVQNTGDLGAGIAGSSPITIKNSIVAQNSYGPTGGNLSGKIVSNGFNIFQDTNKSYLSGDLTGNLVGVDPGLYGLTDNGGATATHALSTSSIARNRGNPQGCRDADGLLLTTDQRGFPRHQLGSCDIGAFEAGSVEGPAGVHIQSFLHLLLPGD